MSGDRKIPTSRVGRTTRLGRLAAGQAARQFATRAANLTRNDIEAQKALEQRQIKAAEQIVDVLGTMKGAAMKLGQVMSFLDVGLVPSESREEFQKKLAKLRDAAPSVSFAAMRKVIETDLEQPLSEVFADFNEQPIAAASIGQVYEARLKDGRRVAVKVQYPGVSAAVRADMKNLGLIMRLLKRVAPGMDFKAITQEIQERIDDELDYELEAQNQRSIARIFRDHPFIVVPDVVTELSRERVIVTEYVSGRGFEQMKCLPKDQRDRIGEIIFRFFFGCLYRHHQFSGDPHPGNFMLLDDGRIAFLDFGLFKRMNADSVAAEIKIQRRGAEGKADELFELLVELDFIPKANKFKPADLLEQYLDVAWWYLADEWVDITPEIATQVIIEMSDPRSKHFRKMRHENLPADHLFARRVEGLTLAVLGQLYAGANWFSIASEWIFNAEPQTELGRQEATFLQRRGR